MIFRYVIQELRHHHNRAMVNILGIAVGIALFVSINAIAAAYQKAVSQPFKNIGADLVVQKPVKRDAGSVQTPTTMQGIRLPFSNQLIEPEEVQRLTTIKGVGDSAASLLLWEFAQGGFRTIMGIDLTQSGLGPVKVKDWLAEGRFPTKEGELVLEKHYAKFHHTRLGDSLSIAGHSFKVVGLLAIKEGVQVAAANIYMPIADARKLLGSEATGANIVYLRLKDPSLLEEVKKQIGKEFQGMSVTSSDSFLELMGGVSKISGQFAFIISLVALIAAIFLIIKTMLGNLIERSREIGILKALGWTEKDIQKQLMGEALLQSIAGGILGLVIGYVISWILGFISIPVTTPWQLNLMPAFAKAEAAASTEIRLPVSISAGLIYAALAISIIAGMLASFFMGRRTARMKPADILRKL
jgi:ABC-type antimicrobial peptide transport system permease subunit